MKLLDAINSKEILVKLLDREMPVVIAYRLQKLVKAIEPELAHFEETRNSLIRKYGIEHDNGMIEVTPGTMGYSTFVNEINSLLEMELDITVKPIDLKSIPFQMTPKEVSMLEWLLEGDDDA